MEILPGIKIAGLGLYLEKEKALVISDLHIGQEEALNKEGILVPRFQLKRLLDELKSLIEATKPRLIIINGDLKHEFGTISEQEWRDTLKVLDYLGRHTEQLILIKGNHDTILGPIATKREIKTQDSFKLGTTLIMHGHKLPTEAELESVATIIIGHEHPAISIRDNIRSELFKCFLLGNYKRKKLVVMPSLNFVAEGTDILSERLLSPFLNKSAIGNFEAYVAADKSYRFGKLKEILKLRDP